MKVSVIIPTYNRARLVVEAVETVLSQTFRDFELIVVDDGSTDGTVEALARFADPRLRVVALEHRGMPGAWVSGLERARGEYVARLDSDDRWLPHCLGRLVSLAERNPSAAVVYGRARAIDAAGRPQPQLTGNPEPFPGRTLVSILYGDFVPQIAALVRRTALRDFSGDESVAGAGDWDLWVQLAGRGKFMFVDDIVAEFRMHSLRSTAPTPSSVARVARARLRVLEKAFSRPDPSGELLAIRPLAYRNLHVDIGLRWLAARSPREARSSFGRALRTGVNPLGTISRIAYLALFYALVRRGRFATGASDAISRRRRARRALAGGA